jgi:DNA-binding transcriptional ArsR family regulator
MTDAARMVGVSPATASYHLHVLTAAGLATRTVKGRRIIYRLPRSRWQLVRVATKLTTPTSAVPKL